MEINEKTWKYIRQHADEDVRRLALQGTKDADVDLQQALQQIAGRQTARQKLPSWAATEGIVYPPHLNMEQCSSELTARYKQRLVAQDSATDGTGGTYVDLTGGFGVDFYWMSQGYGRRIYVEQDATLCELASHNFRLLGLECEVCCCDTATYLTEAVTQATAVYLDPARRNIHGGRTYGIADCTPNVLELLPMLREKASPVVLKLSPMLDWRKAVSDLQQVSEVHIVSVDNECKELLIIISNKEGATSLVDGGPAVVCVNLCKDGEQLFTFDASIATPTTSRPSLTVSPSSSLISQYLYVPNASIMKAGCFAALEQHYPVSQVAPNSHLFLSCDEIDDFPGRRFQITAISSASAKKVYQKFTTMKSANISVRNFPMTAEQLRKKLKLKDGGDTYIFATTMADGQPQLFICRKIG